LGPAGTEDLSLEPGIQSEVITAIMSHHFFGRERRRRATTRCFHLLPDSGVYITFENIRPGTEYSLEAGFKRWIDF